MDGYNGHGKLFFYSYFYVVFRCVVTLIYNNKEKIFAAEHKKSLPHFFYYFTLFTSVCLLYLFFVLHTVGKVFQVA